ncbi:MAG: universal stress protein [Pirellulaceae bacterium]|nr:universal stress protein [Pirellulaceae bacterium]
MAWFPKKNVVVPVDFSTASLAAVDVGLALVDQPAHLHVVHVVIDITPLEAGEVWGVIDPQSRMEQVEKALREKLADAKYAGIQTTVLLGEPAHGIANYAQEKQADLIVIPSHGRTGLTRLLIGSVAERVVRLAHCPVLVLRK